jgi:hypothetical protein
MLSFHVSLEAYFLPKPIPQVVFRGSSLGMQPEALGTQRRTNLLRAPSLNLKYSFPLTTVFMTPGGTCFWKAPSFRIHLGVCVCVSTHIIVPSFISAGNSCSTACKSGQYLISFWGSVRVMF